MADRPEDVAADLAELAPLTACCLVHADPASGEWRGAVAWDLGGPGEPTAPERAWLFGPWARTKDPDEHVILLAAALARLPASVRRVDNFVDLDFAAGLAAHARCGFDPRRTVHILRARAHRAVPSPVAIERVIAPSVGDRDALAGLHDAAFPDTHTTLDGMLSADDGVLWCARDDAVVGYVYATRSADSGAGCIEYVAVRPDARGRGIGRGLLSTATGWLFGRGSSEVFLTVDADNARALGVYHAAGFEHHRSGRALTLRRPSPSR